MGNANWQTTVGINLSDVERQRTLALEKTTDFPLEAAARGVGKGANGSRRGANSLPGK